MRRRYVRVLWTLLLTMFFVAPIGPVHGQECGDVDDSGTVAATDALLVLKRAVGQAVELVCAAGVPVGEYTSIQGFVDVDDPVQFVEEDVFTVPDGKRLLVDYVSLDLDAVILVVGESMVDVETLPVKAVAGGYVLGLMERIHQTTRGAPQRFLGRSVTFALEPGEVLRLRVSPEFSGVNFAFGRLIYKISARLIDVPV